MLQQQQLGSKGEDSPVELPGIGRKQPLEISSSSFLSSEAGFWSIFDAFRLAGKRHIGLSAML